MALDRPIELSLRLKKLYLSWFKNAFWILKYIFKKIEPQLLLQAKHAFDPLWLKIYELQTTSPRFVLAP